MENPTVAANGRYVQAVFHSGGTLVFTFDFPVDDPSSVEVFLGTDQLRFTEDYAVSLDENTGGFVNLLAEPADGTLITIRGGTPYARSEWYSEPRVDPAALNQEMNGTMYRLQQLNRDIHGCLRNPVNETEVGNAVLPKTEDRKGKVAVWGAENGALLYNDGSAQDPLTQYLRKDQNLADVDNIANAKANLSIVEGHTVNNLPWLPKLHFYGNGVAVSNSIEAGVTSVTISETIRSFSDLQGVASIAQGGTGATNANDAKKNLGLAKLATSAEFSDLQNVPSIVSSITNIGTGVGVFQMALGRVARLRSLLSSDGSVGISPAPAGDALDFSVARVTPAIIDGILPPAKGGTGHGPADLSQAPTDGVLVVNESKDGYAFKSPTALAMTIEMENFGAGEAVNVDYVEETGKLQARTIKAGPNMAVSIDDGDGSILLWSTTPTASKTSIGGVIIGDGIDVSQNGTISVPKVGHTIEDSTGASLAQRSGLQFVGAVVTDDADNGRTVVTVAEPTIPPASDSILGGIIVGEGLEATPSGVLSINATTDMIPEGTQNIYHVPADWNAKTGPAAILNIPKNLLESIVGGEGVVVDATDPKNPILSAASADGEFTFRYWNWE